MRALLAFMTFLTLSAGSVHAGANPGSDTLRNGLPKCDPAKLPEFPFYSPARAAVTRADGICDVVEDYVAQTIKAELGELSREPILRNRRFTYEEESNSKGDFIDEDDSPDEEGSTLDQEDASSEAWKDGVGGTSTVEAPAYAAKLPYIILLHSKKRIRDGSLQELRKIINMCNQFGKVIVVTHGDLAEFWGQEQVGPGKLGLIFTDDPDVVHTVRKTPYMTPSFYEGYFLNAPNIASGLRRFAVLNGIPLSNDPGTRFPGGIDWVRTDIIRQREEKEALINKEKENDTLDALTMAVIDQSMATVSYAAHEDLMDGIDQTLKYLHAEMAHAADEAKEQAPPVWYLLYHDNPEKSKCYMARLVNTLVQANSAFIPPVAYVGQADEVNFWSRSEWMNKEPSELPSGVFVLVIDDNSCTGGQMSSFIKEALPILVYDEPRLMHPLRNVPLRVIVSPIFSTVGARDAILSKFETVTTSQESIQLGRLRETREMQGMRLTVWNKKARFESANVPLQERHRGIRMDSVFQYYQKDLKGSKDRNYKIDLLQYVILSSIFEKVFLEGPTASKDPSDPRGRFSEFQRLQEGRVDRNTGKPTRELYRTTRVHYLNDGYLPSRLDSTLFMGKVSVVMDWKVVDSISMPEELVNGGFGLQTIDAVPARFIQGTCPPYKVADPVRIRQVLQLCAKQAGMKGGGHDRHDHLYYCDHLVENINAESSRFDGYRVEDPETMRCTTDSGTWKGKSLEVRFQTYSKFYPGPWDPTNRDFSPWAEQVRRRSTYFEVFNDGTKPPPSSSLCKRVDCLAKYLAERKAVAVWEKVW